MSSTASEAIGESAHARDAALAVLRRLRAAGHEAYLVGGCVRDRLLALPSKDYDVASSATPDEVRALFRKVIPVGVQFGICRVRLRGVETEVATFRSDQGYDDGRHPRAVRFTSAKEDALRRDFTINGLLYDPAAGQVIDHVGGRADLERRVVRAIGDPDDRFAEDLLRMLRAVRFAARFGFSIDPATDAAIRRHAPRIVQVSAERIRDELLHVLTDGGVAVGLPLLRATGLLAAVLPEVAALAARRLDTGEDALARTEAVLAVPGPIDARLGLAALLHQTNEPGAEAVGTRLRLPRRVIRTVTAAVRDLPDCPAAASWPPSRLKRLLRAPHAATLVALHAREAQAVDGKDLSESARFLEERQETIGEDALRPPPLLDGHDLKRMGYPPGPLYAEILELLETAQLDERIATPEEARALLVERFGAPRDWRTEH